MKIAYTPPTKHGVDVSRDKEDKANLVEEGVHVHSLSKGEFKTEVLDKSYRTPFRMHKDGFSDEFLEHTLTNVQHGLFGKWGLLGEKGGNDSFADRSSVYIFGQCYGRGHLDLKTRGLMVLASLCVLQRENVMPTWANACLNLDWTEDELKELGAMVSHIGGFPPSRSALMHFDHVFEKRRAADGQVTRVERDPSAKETAATTGGELYTRACAQANLMFGTPAGDMVDVPLMDPEDPLVKETVCWVFGYLFGERSLIPLKAKVLAFIAMCAALGRKDMLRRWLTAAGRTGSTREEVQEVIITTAMYGGWPAARESLEVLAAHWPTHQHA